MARAFNTQSLAASIPSSTVRSLPSLAENASWHLALGGLPREIVDHRLGRREHRSQLAVGEEVARNRGLLVWLHKTLSLRTSSRSQRIEKAVPNGQGFTAKRLHDSLTEIRRCRSDTEIHPLGEFRTTHQHRHIFTCRTLMDLPGIAPVIAGHDEQVARTKLSEQRRKSSIKIVEGLSRRGLTGFEHIQSDINQS